MQKFRYQCDEFDLNLTYIPVYRYGKFTVALIFGTKQFFIAKITAMSFPSSGNMSIYRNPISEPIL